MKATSLIFASIIFLSIGNILLAGSNKEITTSSPVSPSADSSSILSKINGKIGLFKTYDDFVNNKPKKMKFVKWTYLYTGGTNLKYFKAVFETPDGKHETLSCDEFWGFRSNDGLYRSLPFYNDNVKAVSYRLYAIADGYYFWEVSRLGSIHLGPTYQNSNGVNGTPEDKLSEKAQTAFKCIGSAYSKKGYSLDWAEALPKYKLCPNLQFILDQNYEGKVENTYFKSNSEVVKKYIAIQP
jgi:hypothetical protein